MRDRSVEALGGNVLTFRIQEDEMITVKFKRVTLSGKLGAGQCFRIIGGDQNRFFMRLSNGQSVDIATGLLHDVGVDVGVHEVFLEAYEVQRE